MPLGDSVHVHVTEVFDADRRSRRSTCHELVTERKLKESNDRAMLPVINSATIVESNC